MTIPNMITMARFCLVPVIIVCVVSQAWASAFWLFLAAGLSDGVDGFIAKRFDQRSELGAILDPLADKALLVSLFIALGLVEALPAWLVILVVLRDVMIIAAVIISWALDRPLAIKASRLSKVNTAAQIVLVQFVLFTRGFGFDLPSVTAVGAAFVAALTLASAAAYLRLWIGHMAWSAGYDR
jgi:cardiolipin synthase (CMP-forming)